jgi:hypothetical protein
LLLSVLLYTQVGYYWQFLIVQLQLREKAHEAWLSHLPDGQFYRISLADLNARGKWQDEGRECWYKEHLYDVIRQKDIGGKTYLFCLDDEREARLIEQSGEVARVNADQEQAQHNPRDYHNPQDHPGKKSNPGFPGKMGDVILSPNHTGIRFLLRAGPVTWTRSRSNLPEHYQEIAPRPPWADIPLAYNI